MYAKLTFVVNDVALEGSQLLSEHGLSFWIETDNGVVLLDTGQSASVLSHNLSALGLDAQQVRAVALSHAHFDHTGGLGYILENNPEMDIYAHPGILNERYSRKNGKYKEIGIPETLKGKFINASLHLSSAPTQITPGLWTTGEIVDRSKMKGSSANHFIQAEGDWQPDDYRDDISLVLQLEESLAVICGCCHAGLLNTIHHVNEIFTKPIGYIFGGTHLLAFDKPSLAELKRELDDLLPDALYYLNHCTGVTAIEYLSEAFGPRVAAFPAGSSIMLN